MLRYFFVFFLLVNQSLWAEYRVFELEITAYEEAEEIGKRVVVSTLDPEQYRGYHSVQPNEKIRYISTWRCRGRTAGKDYCPNPKAKTDAEEPAIPSENK
ncbi:MAG: hypothetical protein JNM24_07285 [Bdellovibrionaceae bacterium]|jgi:hypothetical protein|nr:hypothetical protein [Pseudobdellovibrionaceae bacterium]